MAGSQLEHGAAYLSAMATQLGVSVGIISLGFDQKQKAERLLPACCEDPGIEGC